MLVIAAESYVFAAAGGVDANPAEQNSEQKWLSVSGSASVPVVPDTASISLGVITQATTAKEASEKNAASMNAVISALKDLGLQDRDIQTSLLSIQPVYSTEEGDIPTIIGYSASNSVQVTTKMLDKLSDIIDRSVAAGANQVSGISFIVSEEMQKQVRDGLITDAVEDAEDKANKLAESLKVRIVGVKTSSISEGDLLQPFISAPVALERIATPILPGESRITLSVQVTYIIEDE